MRDLARAGRGDGGRVIVAGWRRALDLLRSTNSSNTTFVVSRRVIRRPFFQRGAVRNLGDADAGRAGGLSTKDVAEFGLNAVQHHRAVQLSDRRAAGGDPLPAVWGTAASIRRWRRLIHAETALPKQHAAANVHRDAGQLKQALWIVPSSLRFCPCMTGAQMSMWDQIRPLPSFSGQMPWSFRSGS